MLQWNKRWSVLASGVLVAGAATLIAQTKPNFSTMDTNQAREITQLIEQGQIGLHEAIRLVETKSNGKALECFTMLEMGSPTMGQPGGSMGGAADRPGQPGGADRPGQGDLPGKAGQPGATAGKIGADKQQVVYHVRVFANGNLTPYMVDAKTREVTEIGDRFKQTGDRPTLDRNKDKDIDKD